MLTNLLLRRSAPLTTGSLWKTPGQRGRGTRRTSRPPRRCAGRRGTLERGQWFVNSTVACRWATGLTVGPAGQLLDGLVRLWSEKWARAGRGRRVPRGSDFTAFVIERSDYQPGTARFPGHGLGTLGGTSRYRRGCPTCHHSSNE